MDSSFVIIGLPASGKTTFLAALWHLVEADELACRLKLDSYKGDLAYLNLIAEAWRSFRKVPRTSQVGETDVTINLVDRETGAKGVAVFPDLAGETFDAQIEGRRCRPDFVDDLAEDDGILFFLSADLKGNSLSIIELNAMLPPSSAADEPDKSLGARLNLTGDGVNVSTAPREWEPKLVPAQVRVVQLLSDLLRPPFAHRRRRLAVIISAWDLAKGMKLQPRAWLAAHMPLVDQFLRTNGDFFDHEVYGISAQGVSLEDTAGIDEASKLTPSRRIQIVGPDGTGHDITMPLVWLMA